MDKLLNKAIKTKTITEDELKKLTDYINLPENQDDFYMSSSSKKDRIGNYREFFLNPSDLENQKKFKIYEISGPRDLVAFKLQYYDILRDENTSFLKKSMLLYTLQKRIEYTFKKELKEPDDLKQYKEIENLLNKVKKARSYYAYKVFLDNNSSDKKIKNSNDSVTKVVKKSK